MSDTQDDLLLGLLTDLAEGVAALSARVDAMEGSNAAHQAQVNEALATIAEIATRTYYASKPPSALPDDVINTGVMDAMIERWPQGATVPLSRHDQQLLNELDRHSIEMIEGMIARGKATEHENNASRLRMGVILDLLNREKERRAKAQDVERDAPGRSR
jgi:hypothetical protein